MATVRHPLPVIQEDEPAGQPPGPKKKLLRRAAADRSQALRLSAQVLFLLLNVALGIQFYLFVRYFQAGGQGARFSRPPGVEGWLPIAGLMNLKYWAVTGTVPSIHPAAMFILLAFLIISIVFRKAFCSWLCPIGTISEALWRFGRKVFRVSVVPPRWIDLPLRGLKYLLLGLFLYAVGSMSAEGLRGFMESPYGLIADVKMLYFFLFLSRTATITLLVLVLLSVFIQNLWCRYICPYGALVGFASLFSPARIRRDAKVCIDCAKCAKACPSFLPVDKLVSVRSAECTACLECVAVCPAAGALQFSLPNKRAIPSWAMAAGIAVIFLGIVGIAKLTGHWHTKIPPELYQDLILRADEFSHP